MTARRARLTALAVAVALVASACSKQSPSALNTAGDEAKRIAGVWWLMFVMATVVYVVVAGFVVFGSLRGRHRRREERERTVRDDVFIWIGGIIVPVMILAFLAVVTVHTGVSLRKVKPGELHVEVLGERWWWRVRYSNPSFETANEVHLPVDRPVAIGLDSDNVIHSFWVPQLASKVDTIPGQHNVLRFTPRKIGVYRGLCAEYCGLQHAHMEFLVVVQSEVDYGRWVARRNRPAAEPASELAARGRLVFERETCAGCHTVDGTGAVGTLGPNLTDFGNRSTIGAATLDNTQSNLVKWITNPGDAKPGVLMPPAVIAHDDVVAIATYLESLK